MFSVPRLLCLVLLLCAVAFPQDRDTSLRTATEAARSQQYDRAVEIYHRLLTADPADYEAMVGLARVRGWQRHYIDAEGLFRKALAVHPQDDDTRLGLADVLAWQGKRTEALNEAKQVAQRQPKNSEALLRIARYSRWNGDGATAREYYGRVLAIDPQNAEAIEAMKSPLAPELRNSVEVGFYGEDFDQFPETQAGFVEYIRTQSEKFSWRARITLQNKFDETDPIGGAGFTVRVARRTWLSGDGAFSGPGAVVVPQALLRGELTQAVSPQVALGGGYAYMHFQSAEVHLPSAFLNADLTREVHFTFHYTPALTHFQGGSSVWNQGGWTKLSWDVTPSFSPYIDFGIGNNSFTGITSDQLGSFAAHTYGGGAEIRFGTGGVRVDVYDQLRSGDHRQTGYAFSYFRKF